MEYEDIKRGKPSRKKSRVKRPTNGAKLASFAKRFGKLLGLRGLVKRGWNTLLALIAGINRKKINKLVDRILFYLCLAGLCVMAWWGARGFIDNWACWAFFYTALVLTVNTIIRK